VEKSAKFEFLKSILSKAKGGATQPLGEGTKKFIGNVAVPTAVGAGSYQVHDWAAPDAPELLKIAPALISGLAGHRGYAKHQASIHGGKPIGSQAEKKFLQSRSGRNLTDIKQGRNIALASMLSGTTAGGLRLRDWLNKSEAGKTIGEITQAMKGVSSLTEKAGPQLDKLTRTGDVIGATLAGGLDRIDTATEWMAQNRKPLMIAGGGIYSAILLSLAMKRYNEIQRVKAEERQNELLEKQIKTYKKSLKQQSTSRMR